LYERHTVGHNYVKIFETLGVETAYIVIGDSITTLYELVEIPDEQFA
jgi:hypothetical protein